MIENLQDVQQIIKPRQIRGLGWKPDLPDHRDLVFRKPRTTGPIASVSLKTKHKMPPILDQDQLGACTGHGIAGVIAWLILNGKSNLAPQEYAALSRMFIYYNERVIEGTVNEDSGAFIRDGIKTVNKLGVCLEEFWAYDISRFTDQPPPEAYADGMKRVALTYQRVGNTKAELVGCLQSGFPFVFGFSVYDGFESDKVAKTGTVKLPGKKESLLGGHCVWSMAYAKGSDRFTCANSWGEGWGKKGYFTLPAAYLTNNNLADDFWMISKVQIEQ